MGNTEPTTKITYRWIAPQPATWKTYIFYRGIAFDLAPYLDQSLRELLEATSQAWGISINPATPYFYRLYRAINRLRILRDGQVSFENWRAVCPLTEKGVTA
ncbi:MAG TPA: hypothetical protein O0Y06_06495 [Methanocorpusculum sp.]|nr:hypothetical protein [Methanocorpusculum sp.]HJK80534.1 hypothetical protein [Methanocorpusculum sp.]